MKRLQAIAAALFLVLSASFNASAWDLSRILSAGVKAVQAATISDSQIQNYVHEYIQYEDQKNQVAAADSPYTIRLMKLTEGLDDVDGVPLNFKVYITKEINAFACADGSVRVYSGLMDLMNDDEVLGVIGHEIGHVAHKDTKNAFKNALLVSAFRDGISSAGGVMQRLSDSQLGALSENLVNAKYSQKQETNADDYGYDFLKSHGKNPWSMAMAFAKLGSMEGSANNSNGLAQLFSSHPDTGKRVENIVKKCQKDHIAPPADYFKTTNGTTSTTTTDSGSTTVKSATDSGTKKLNSTKRSTGRKTLRNTKTTRKHR